MKKNKSKPRSGVRKCEDNNKRKFQKDWQGKKEQEGAITQLTTMANQGGKKQGSEKKERVKQDKEEKHGGEKIGTI